MPMQPSDPEKPSVARPVIAASLLKLGKPLDPRKLPDRFVPHQRTAPKHEIIASREEPAHKTPDAGLPPLPPSEESDVVRTADKVEPFAENVKDRPEEGRAGGVREGNEPDPDKVRSGDEYAAKLSQWLHDRWQYPTIISQGEANRLCVTFRVNLNTRMAVWAVRSEPEKSSGNDLFDDSARSMLQKLKDDQTPLPEPPPEVADRYRNHKLNLVLSGDLHGDTSRCH
jgi:hypothetical protein